MQYTHTSEHEVKHIIRQTLILAAQHLNIPHPQLEDSFLLHEEIKNRNEPLFNLLNEFSEAYLNFYYTGATLTAHKKSALLTDAEKNRLHELFERKEKLKAEVLKAISA